MANARRREETNHPRDSRALALVAAGLAGVAFYSARRWRLSLAELGRLRTSEARFRSLVERVPAITYMWDVNPPPGSAPHMYTSPQSLDVLGFTPEEWGADPDLWVRQLHPDDRERILEATEKSEQSGEPFNVDYRLLTKDGRVVWLHDEAVVTEWDSAGRPRVMQGVLMDVTHRMELETELRRRTQELERLSMTDELTGLLNPRGFELIGDHEMKVADRTKRPLALLFLDVDGLKLINDDHGHASGNTALHDLAEILRQTFRGSDILARVGGDEFCVLLTTGEPIEMDEVSIARLQDAISRHNEESPEPYALSVSVGVSRFDPECPRSLGDLMEEADQRMYRAKRARRAGRTAAGPT